MAHSPDRKIAQLDCGLVVIAQRMSTASVASVQCWLKAGSIFEPERGGAGVSHFVEHLVSGGSTSRRTAAESRELLGRLGAQMDAHTGLDTVHYHIETATADAPAAIELLSDWMQNALLTPEEFAVQRAVIQNELATSRGEPGRVLWTLTQQARYPHHPARHPTIGHLDAFLALSRDDVHRSYAAMYVPNNMVFVVAGDVDPEQIVAQVSEQWATAVARPVPELSLPVEPPLVSPRYLRGYAAVERPRVRLVWPGVRLGAPGHHALDVLARVLGQGAKSRLAKRVRDQQRLATSVGAYNLSFAWGDGFFGVDAIPTATTSEALDDVAAAIRAQIEEVRIGGVTPDELARAKRKLVSAEVFTAQTAHAAAARIGRDFIQLGDPDSLQRYAARIQEIKGDEVHDVALRFLDPDRVVTIHLLGPPAGQAESSAPPAAFASPSAGEQPLATERVAFDNAALLRKVRALGPAGERVAAAATPPKLALLPNGLRVIVQHSPRLPIVAIQWHQLGGLLSDEPGREGVANAVSVMMTRGAGALAAEEISRTIEGLGASLTAGFNHSTSSVSAECLESDWRTVLGLVSDVVQQPRFPAAEWANVKPRLQSAIALHNDLWHRHLLGAIRGAYFDGGHPWSQLDLGRTEVVRDLAESDLARFHANHLAARDGVLAIFGDVDEDEVLAEVMRLFGSMRREPVTSRALPICGSVQPRRVQITTTNPLAAAQLAYGPGLTRRCQDYATLLVMNKVLDRAGGWLDAALRERGLVYTLGAGMMAGAAPGYWAMMFSCRPQNAHEANTRALGVLDRIRTELADDATLARAKASALLSEALGLQSNAQRATGAAHDELFGFGFDESLRLRDAIFSVDARSVRDAAVRYLDTLVAVELVHAAAG